MVNKIYNTPKEGALDWHNPPNENFDQLDRDIEIRDTEANRSNYTIEEGAEFIPVDSGATYTGDGSSWNLLGYVARVGGGDLGHYVNYEDGLEDEEIDTFFFGPDEYLEIIRASFLVKGLAADTTEPDVALRVYEGGTSGILLLEIEGNELVDATDSSALWIGSSSPVTVTVSNTSGSAVDVVPKIWAKIRR